MDRFENDDKHIYIYNDQLVVMIDVLEFEIKKNIKQLDNAAIIAVGRGGFIPSVYLSHRLNNADIYPIMYSAPDGEGRSKYDVSLKREHQLDSYRNLLIVDDIIDSGKTMKNIHHFYHRQYKHTATISTVCLIHQANNKLYTPTYSAEQIKSTDGQLFGKWIVFPWEDI